MYSRQQKGGNGRSALLFPSQSYSLPFLNDPFNLLLLLLPVKPQGQEISAHQILDKVVDEALELGLIRLGGKGRHGAR